MIPAFHAAQIRPNMVLHALAFFMLLYGNLVVAGVGLDPRPIFTCPLRQDLWGDRILSMHVAEEMDDVRGPGEQRQVPLDDDAVKTVIYKDQEALKELRKLSIGRLRQIFGSISKIICPAADGINNIRPESQTSSPRDFKGVALGYF